MALEVPAPMEIHRVQATTSPTAQPARLARLPQVTFQDTFTPAEEPLPRLARSVGVTPREDVKSLLESMKPFLRDVHVVVPPGRHGEPPILSGSAPPRGMKPFPSQRWTVTPQIEAAHRQWMETASNEELHAQDGVELQPFIAPILERRYGDRTGMAVLELGPATSTTVPVTLREAADQYFGMDLSLPLLEKQRDLVHEHGHTVDGALQVQGDTYGMPFQDGTCDLVFTSCHPPFVSASPEDQVVALSEVARVLKPGGEFVLFPWYSEKKDSRVQDYLLRTYEVVERHSSPGHDDRQLLVLRKR